MEAPREGPNFAPIGNLLLRHESHLREPGGGGNDRDGRNGRKSSIPSYPPRGPPETPPTHPSTTGFGAWLEAETTASRQNSQGPGGSPLLGLDGFSASLPHDLPLRLVLEQLLQDLCKMLRVAHGSASASLLQ